MKGYCKDRVGDDYVARGAYGVLQSRDTRIMQPVEFASRVQPGMELEMSIMLRQHNNLRDTRKECPRCHFINIGVTYVDAWVEWQVCPSLRLNNAYTL